MQLVQTHLSLSNDVVVFSADKHKSIYQTEAKKIFSGKIVCVPLKECVKAVCWWSSYV